MQNILQAIKISLGGKWYKVLFVISTLVLFALLVLIPAKSVVGNSFALQLTLFTGSDYAVLIFLSLLYALFITMQVYAMKSGKKAQGVGATVGGSASAIFAGVAGTAFCASCLAPLFALFGIGFGGVIFVLEYRLYFVIAVVVLMLIAIYFTSKRILKTCNNC